MQYPSLGAAAYEAARRLLETSPVPMALLSLDGKIEQLNSKFIEIFGYQAEEIPDLEAWWPRAYPDPGYRQKVIDEWCGRMGKTKDGDELAPYEAHVVCRDGSVRTIEWRGTHIGSCFLVVGADLTDQLRAVQALHTSEQRHRLLLETAPEAIVVFDADRGHFIESNVAAERLFKYDRETLRQLDPAAMSPALQPDGRSSAEAAASYIALALAGETPVFEWTHRDRMGRDIPCEVRLLKLPDPTHPRLIRGSIVDISERKQAEDKLRSNEERFRLLVENSTELVVQINRHGVIFYASPNHLAMTGQPAEEMIGENVFSFIHPDDVAGVREALRSGVAREVRVFRYRYRDGSWHWFETVSRRFRTASGDEMDALISRDITPRVNAENVRKQLEVQLREAQKMEAIGTLAGGIAHDFNNILTGLFGSLQLAEEELPPGHSVRPLLNASFRACLRARDLVAKILTFSRRREQKMEVHPLGPIIREALGLLRASLPATIQIQPELSAEAGAVRCDPVQIHQVIMNLATNAAYAMRDQGGVLTVALDEAKPGTHALGGRHEIITGPVLRLTVTDTGLGMDAVTRARVFEPFFTTKPLGEGTGLGLAVVHGIVENHGGAIAIESAVGIGTTVRVWLPAAETPLHRLSVAPFPMPRGHGERILFIDDEPVVVDVGVRILRRLGYETSAFLQPAAALEALRLEPLAFALVISDLTMPGMTGLDLIQEMRRIRLNLPVVITTGYARTAEIEQVRSLGVNHILEKPFTMENLAQHVRSALQGD